MLETDQLKPVEKSPILSPSTELVFLPPKKETQPFYTPPMLYSYDAQIRKELKVSNEVMLTEPQREYARTRRVVFDDAFLKGLKLVREKIQRAGLTFPFPDKKVGFYEYNIQDGEITWNLKPNSASIIDKINFKKSVESANIPTFGQTQIEDELFLAQEALRLGLDYQKQELNTLFTSANKLKESFKNPVFLELSSITGTLSFFDNFVTEMELLKKPKLAKNKLESDSDFEIRKVVAENPDKFYQLLVMSESATSYWKNLHNIENYFKYYTRDADKNLDVNNFDKFLHALGLFILDNSQDQPHLNEALFKAPAVYKMTKQKIVEAIKDTQQYLKEVLADSSSVTFHPNPIPKDPLFQNLYTNQKIEKFLEIFEKYQIDKKLGLKLISYATKVVTQYILDGKEDSFNYSIMFRGDGDMADTGSKKNDTLTPESSDDNNLINEQLIRLSKNQHINRHLSETQQMSILKNIFEGALPKSDIILHNLLDQKNFSYNPDTKLLEMTGGKVNFQALFFSYLYSEINNDGKLSDFILTQLSKKFKLALLEKSGLIPVEKFQKKVGDNTISEILIPRNVQGRLRYISNVLTSQADFVAKGLISYYLKTYPNPKSDWENMVQIASFEGWDYITSPAFFMVLNSLPKDQIKNCVTKKDQFRELVEARYKYWSEELAKLELSYTTANKRPFYLELIDKTMANLNKKYPIKIDPIFD